MRTRSLSTQAVKWPRKQVCTSLGKTMLPFLAMFQCPCFRGYSTTALLLLRHMTTNLLFTQVDKCFISITVNYVCQLLISSQYFMVYFVLNCIFAWNFLALQNFKNKQTKNKATGSIRELINLYWEAHQLSGHTWK